MLLKRTLIFVISILVPLVVVLLYVLPKWSPSTDLSFLPTVYATINLITAVVLVLAFRAIRQKKIIRHRRLMTLSLALSVLFLILYVIYHSTHESTTFGGEGRIRVFYYFLLISHIVLSAVIVPLVLITLRKALKGQYESHRKWAKWTWPIWFYVAISGVLVYILISPYYP